MTGCAKRGPREREKVWRHKIVFRKLNRANPGSFPVWLIHLNEGGAMSSIGRFAHSICRSAAALACTAATCVMLPASGWCGSARDYLNAPVDSWFTSYNLSYNSLVTPEDGLDAVTSVRSNVVSQSLVFTRIMDFEGRTGGLSLVLPYRDLSASSGGATASANGVSDVGALWQMNIFGGPALSRADFASFVPQTFASFHLFVGTPLGTYDPTSPLNPSANRWSFSPTINFSYTPDEGWTWIETYLGATAFTPNNDYRVAGASSLTQKPLLRLEEHLSRNLTPTFWASLDAYYNAGGETSVDDTPQGNAANTLRLGAGIGARLWAGGDLTVNYERVVAKPAGQPDAQSFRMAIRQFW